MDTFMFSSLYDVLTVTQKIVFYSLALVMITSTSYALYKIGVSKIFIFAITMFQPIYYLHKATEPFTLKHDITALPSFDSNGFAFSSNDVLSIYNSEITMSLLEIFALPLVMLLGLLILGFLFKIIDKKMLEYIQKSDSILEGGF